MKFKTKIKSRIKKIREELNNMPQSELAERVGVSRQTIYFLERGKYNPSLTLSFKIAEVLKKPLNEIFYQEPIIRDLIKRKSTTYQEITDLEQLIGIDHDTFLLLAEIDDEELNQKFDKKTLLRVARYLERGFEDLFEE